MSNYQQMNLYSLVSVIIASVIYIVVLYFITKKARVAYRENRPLRFNGPIIFVLSLLPALFVITTAIQGAVQSNGYSTSLFVPYSVPTTYLFVLYTFFLDTFLLRLAFFSSARSEKVWSSLCFVGASFVLLLVLFLAGFSQVNIGV